MAKIMQVANFFVDCAVRKDDVMTNMRLNKLLYFAQVLYLHKTNSRLFDEDFEAWTYGPVVDCVYQEYKSYKNAPIISVAEYYSVESFTESEYKVLVDVLSLYSMFATSYLVDLTHQPNGAWAQTMRKGGGVMPTELIKSDFDLVSVKHDFENCELPLDLVGFRDSNGILVLPNEDDDDNEWSEYDEL